MLSADDKRSVTRILARLSEVFERAGIETPRLDAEVLLAFCLKTDRAGLYRDLTRPLEDDEVDRVLRLAARRKRREPMAYIRGFREFWSFEFLVTPAVLIPRPETECLVEEVLNLRSRYAGCPARILDIGTGSGAVGVAVKAEWPEAEVVATEISREALEVARGNAARILGAGKTIDFVRGDLFEGTAGAFDVVCSNPPYIREAEYERLAGDVRLYEPRQALVAGREGTEFHRRILDGARERLKPGGWVLMEMGADQRPALEALLAGTGLFGEVRFRQDYAGLDRVVIAQKK